MTQQRRRFKQIFSLEERLTREAAQLRSQAEGLPPSVEREQLIRKARQADAASHMSDWLRSAELRAPK